jgi:enoyl-CoA hydratase
LKSREGYNLPLITKTPHLEFSNLFYIVDNDIAIISFNRPNSLNSLNTETILELEQAFDAIAADDSIKGVVLTGEGDKAFVAGADISELQQKNPETALEFSQTGQRALNKIEQLPKPVIAAVNGFALGGGCEIAMACHELQRRVMIERGKPK